MARTVNYENRATKIKEQIDELVNELSNKKAFRPAKRDKMRLIDIDFDGADLVTLMQVQARISRIILDRSK